MAIVTVTGLMGTATSEIGSSVARILRLNYVDYHILAEAATRIGATMNAVVSKVERPVKFRDRISKFIQTVLERSAAAGTGGDPYFGPGPSLELLLDREYAAVVRDPITRAQEIEDSTFINVTRGVIEELALLGDVLVMGRGSHIILKNWPMVVHVGLVAELNARISHVMNREKLDLLHASEYVKEHDVARTKYFKKYFRVDIDDPLNYHLTVNTARFSIEEASAIIAKATPMLRSQ